MVCFFLLWDRSLVIQLSVNIELVSIVERRISMGYRNCKFGTNMTVSMMYFRLSSLMQIGVGSLNSLLSLPAALPSSFSAADIESIENDINTLYRSSRLPIERIYSKFRGYARFNVQQVLPYVPAKWKSQYSDIVLIGVVDRVPFRFLFDDQFLRNNCQYVEKMKNDWTKYNEYRCQPKQFLSLLKSNYALTTEVNSIFQNRYGIDSKECDSFVSDFRAVFYG